MCHHHPRRPQQKGSVVSVHQWTAAWAPRHDAEAEKRRDSSSDNVSLLNDWMRQLRPQPGHSLLCVLGRLATHMMQDGGISHQLYHSTPKKQQHDGSEARHILRREMKRGVSIPLTLSTWILPSAQIMNVWGVPVRVRVRVRATYCKLGTNSTLTICEPQLYSIYMYIYSIYMYIYI